MKPNTEKNKAIVLLRKAGMPLNEIIRVFNFDARGTGKLNFARVWRRDKDKYNLPEQTKVVCP